MQFVNSGSSLPKGYAGQLSRNEAIVEPLNIAASSGLAYGAPVKLNSTGNPVALTANTDKVAFIIVQEHLTAPRGFGVPNTDDFPQGAATVGGLKQGYIIVKVDPADATVVKGAAVKYDRATGLYGTTGAVTVNAEFVSNGVQADGFAEIAFGF